MRMAYQFRCTNVSISAHVDFGCGEFHLRLWQRDVGSFCSERKIASEFRRVHVDSWAAEIQIRAVQRDIAALQNKYLYLYYIYEYIHIPNNSSNQVRYSEMTRVYTSFGAESCTSA